MNVSWISRNGKPYSMPVRESRISDLEDRSNRLSRASFLEMGKLSELLSLKRVFWSKSFSREDLHSNDPEQDPLDILRMIIQSREGSVEQRWKPQERDKGHGYSEIIPLLRLGILDCEKKNTRGGIERRRKKSISRLASERLERESANLSGSDLLASSPASLSSPAFPSRSSKPQIRWNSIQLVWASEVDSSLRLSDRLNLVSVYLRARNLASVCDAQIDWKSPASLS